MAEQHIPGWIDFMPHSLKGEGKAVEQSRDSYIAHLKQCIEVMRDDIVERYCQLPNLMVHPGPHLNLLHDARELFILGKFYPCVAMCGITAERILLDLFKTALCVKVKGVVSPVSDDARDELERAGAWKITQFLVESGVIEKKLGKFFEAVATIRNRYAHGKGGNPQADAEKAIQDLHAIVEGTVSLLVDYDLKAGMLVPKSATPK
jgi:hypothetical protein